jgi:hypothetical protein
MGDKNWLQDVSDVLITSLHACLYLLLCDVMQYMLVKLFYTCMCLLCNSRFKSTTWLELKDMAQDPLVRREPVSASCNRRPDEGLETQTYSLYPKEHPANCPLRWKLSDGLGVYLLLLQAGFSQR